MWVGEMVPAHEVFPEARDDGAVGREILRHRARKSAGAAVGHHLRFLAKRPEIMARGEAGAYQAAADMFAASGMSRLHMGLVLRIGNLVYRVRREG